MRQWLVELWQDECGAMLATEWVFVATILMLGSFTGLVALRQSVISELEAYAAAVQSLNQSDRSSGPDECEALPADGSD